MHNHFACACVHFNGANMQLGTDCLACLHVMTCEPTLVHAPNVGVPCLKRQALLAPGSSISSLPGTKASICKLNAGGGFHQADDLLFLGQYYSPDSHQASPGATWPFHVCVGPSSRAL